MAVIMAFAFMGCQPKIQDLSVKSEKVTANSENWDITVNRSMFSSADANVNKSCDSNLLRMPVMNMLSWMSSKATICSMFPLQIHHPEMRLILS